MTELRWRSARLAPLVADVAMCCEFPGFDVTGVAVATRTPSVHTTVEVFHRAMAMVAATVEIPADAGDTIEELRVLVERSGGDVLAGYRCVAVPDVFDDAVAAWADPEVRAAVVAQLGEPLEAIEWEEIIELVASTAAVCRLAADDGYLEVL